MRTDTEMASSSKRESGEPETPADDTPQVVDGPSAVGVLASRRGTTVVRVALGVLGGSAVFAAAGAAAAGAAAVDAAAVGVGAGFVAVFFVPPILGSVVLGGDISRNAGLLPGVGGAVLLHGAAGLLPGWALCRYREEWAGELYDLRAEGASWWRRTGYLLGILLFSTPRLAVGLRLGGERSRA